MSHNPRSSVHQTSEVMAQHIVDEGGICHHSYPALAAMFKVTVPTVQVVRQHLETCPSNVDGVRIPYRMHEDAVLVDKDGSLPTLVATQQRAIPTVKAAESIIRIHARQRQRIIESMEDLSKDAFTRGDTPLGDALEAAALDYRTDGSLRPLTVKALAAVGITV